ncbi:MAG: SAM-dependent methyltransferase, partial [Cyanobacteria bacterium MAG IRC1_bin_28]|nr:SAM-dependent methyltransferase [Cyanobacteria bacterium MAG IRC1_bin_28]
MNTTAQPPGSVAIVGAGPGAPDLLTLRAHQRIREAQALIWADSLVSPAVAALAPADCPRISTRSLTLEAVMKVTLEQVRAGKRVVRLHDGDPCLYGALHEQICRLGEAGVKEGVEPGGRAYRATGA